MKLAETAKEKAVNLSVLIFQSYLALVLESKGPGSAKNPTLEHKKRLGHARRPKNPNIEHRNPPGTCPQAHATGLGGPMGLGFHATNVVVDPKM